MRLDTEPPVNGWTTVRLTAAGIELAFTASSTPRDSIGDLAQAAASLMAGVPDRVVTWNAEPVEYDFQFLAAEGRTRLEVREFPDRRRRRVEVPRFIVEEDTAAIVRALWRGLRRLQGAAPVESFAATWRHPFPTAVVDRLGNELRRRPSRATEAAEPDAAQDPMASGASDSDATLPAIGQVNHCVQLSRHSASGRLTLSGPSLIYVSHGRSRGRSLATIGDGGLGNRVAVYDHALDQIVFEVDLGAPCMEAKISHDGRFVAVGY